MLATIQYPNLRSGHEREASAGELKFDPNDGFHTILRERVDHYFARTGRSRRDSPRMYVKTAIILGWLAANYAALVFLAGVWWVAIPLAATLGLAMAAVGFTIQHDGSHQAYSRRGWVNRLMALTLELLGGSTYFWARKHNIVHHTYTNVAGHDDDIDIGFFARLAPAQKRRGIHRFQHWYVWALYGFLAVKWQFYDDFRDLIVGKNSGRPCPRPRGWDLVTFIAGKLVFFGLVFGIPLLLHSWWAVLGCYLIASVVQGIALSVVFQLAHCVEEAAFPMPQPYSGRIENAWAIHQIETTVDFARGNRLLSWFVGGLNFQIEHHLFPRICHVHYPALSRIVEQTCREFGVRYTARESFWGGVASHFRWLRRMGRKETVASKNGGGNI